MIEELLDRFRKHDRMALARLLSIVARGESLDRIADALHDSPRRARVLAITGSAGVGKSTLIGKLLPCIRQAALSVAVLACDPESPLSGGALLGDRFRMGSSVDEGIFVRSLAAVGGHGAVAEHADLMIRLLESFGFDIIVLETVGAGQGDVAVNNLADVVLLLLQAESGDEIQWEKAGILELADVVAIHKADLPNVDATFAQVKAALEMTPTRSTPVVRVSSQTGEGVQQLWQTLQSLPLRHRLQKPPSALLQQTLDELTRRWHQAEKSHHPVFEETIHAWQTDRTISPQAINQLLRLLGNGSM